MIEQCSDMLKEASAVTLKPPRPEQLHLPTAAHLTTPVPEKMTSCTYCAHLRTGICSHVFYCFNIMFCIIYVEYVFFVVLNISVVPYK